MERGRPARKRAEGSPTAASFLITRVALAVTLAKSIFDAGWKPALPGPQENALSLDETPMSGKYARPTLLTALRGRASLASSTFNCTRMSFPSCGIDFR
jgi:hypothetical protein